MVYCSPNQLTWAPEFSRGYIARPTLYSPAIQLLPLVLTTQYTKSTKELTPSTVSVPLGFLFTFERAWFYSSFSSTIFLENAIITCRSIVSPSNGVAVASVLIRKSTVCTFQCEMKPIKMFLSIIYKKLFGSADFKRPSGFAIVRTQLYTRSTK